MKAAFGISDDASDVEEVQQETDKEISDSIPLREEEEIQNSNEVKSKSLKFFPVILNFFLF